VSLDTNGEEWSWQIGGGFSESVRGQKTDHCAVLMEKIKMVLSQPAGPVRVGEVKRCRKKSKAGTWVNYGKSSESRRANKKEKKLAGRN